MVLAVSYAPGDIVTFHRPYQQVVIEKGNECQVSEIGHEGQKILLGGTKADPCGGSQVRSRGGSEACRIKGIEFLSDDRIRRTRNDKGFRSVSSGTGEVSGVREGRVLFRLKDGHMLTWRESDPQLRSLDLARASAVHVFQDRTINNVTVTMEVPSEPDRAEADLP